MLQPPSSQPPAQTAANFATVLSAGAGLAAGLLRLRGLAGLLLFIATGVARVAAAARKGSKDDAVGVFDKGAVSTFLIVWILAQA
jgi:hypothetical protein